MRHVLVLSVAFLLAGCMGGAPRKPVPPPHGETPGRDDEDALANARDEDRFSIDSALPRSGDPRRPNVKVELTVVDVTSSGGLEIRAGVAGSIVRGVVNLDAALSAGAGRTRARSRTSTFIVVQAGSASSIALHDDARRLCGPYAGLAVRVISASPRGVELELAPYVAPTSVEGETFSGATRVRVAPGESLVLGGYTQEEDRSSRGILRAEESRASRQLMALLSVKVIG